MCRAISRSLVQKWLLCVALRAQRTKHKPGVRKVQGARPGLVLCCPVPGLAPSLQELGVRMSSAKPPRSGAAMPKAGMMV